MGMESAGFLPAILWAVDLSLGAAGGAILGALTGIAWALFWPRRGVFGRRR